MGIRSLGVSKWGSEVKDGVRHTERVGTGRGTQRVWGRGRCCCPHVWFAEVKSRTASQGRASAQTGRSCQYPTSLPTQPICICTAGCCAAQCVCAWPQDTHTHSLLPRQKEPAWKARSQQGGRTQSVGAGLTLPAACHPPQVARACEAATEQAAAEPFLSQP
eukprot:365783-Chlamydomonas_euryale.AAC.28